MPVLLCEKTGGKHDTANWDDEPGKNNKLYFYGWIYTWFDFSAAFLHHADNRPVYLCG